MNIRQKDNWFIVTWTLLDLILVGSDTGSVGYDNIVLTLLIAESWKALTLLKKKSDNVS